jgi:hypothetical protein
MFVAFLSNDEVPANSDHLLPVFQTFLHLQPLNREVKSNKQGPNNAPVTLFKSEETGSVVRKIRLNKRTVRHQLSEL